MIFWLVLLIILTLLINTYFIIAKKYNVVDVPNYRSSHTSLIVRGGGIIIYLASTIYFIISGFDNLFFFIGLSFVAVTGLIDDIFDFLRIWRILLQGVGIVLMLFQLDLIFSESIWLLIIMLVMGLGTINTANFMDGINGITALYGLIMLVSFYIINFAYEFIDNDFLIYVAMGTIVFAIYNFRNKPKCFAGDVGSMSLGYILVFLTFILLLTSKNPVFILLWSVYGIDSVLTILQRLYNNENILEAHRNHLYQYLANELGYSHLLVASIYGIVQIGINILIYFHLQNNWINSWILVGMVLIVSASGYIMIKNVVLKKIKHLSV